MNVDLPHSNGQKVDVDTNDTEYGSKEGQNKVDVPFDPAEFTATVDTDIVEEGVNKKREENHEKRSDVAKHVVLGIPRVVRLKHFHEKNIDLESRDEHPEEGGEEKIVKRHRNHGTKRGELGLTNSY